MVCPPCMPARPGQRAAPPCISLPPSPRRPPRPAPPDAGALAEGHVHILTQARQHALLPVPRRKLVAWRGAGGEGEGTRAVRARPDVPWSGTAVHTRAAVYVGTNAVQAPKMRAQAGARAHAAAAAAAGAPMTGLRLNRSLMLACLKPFSLPEPTSATWGGEGLAGRDRMQAGFERSGT